MADPTVPFHRGEDLVMPVHAQKRVLDDDGLPVDEDVPLTGITVSADLWWRSAKRDTLAGSGEVTITDEQAGEFDVRLARTLTATIPLGAVAWLKFIFDDGSDRVMAGPLYLEGVLP